MKPIRLYTNATRSVILVLCLMVTGSWLHPQPRPQPEKPGITLDEHSTLQDFLDTAERNNPGLQAAYDQWQAALAQVPQVRALPNPQLTYTYYLRQVETRVGPQYHKIGIMQMFPWFGKLGLKGNAAQDVANAEKQKYESLKLNLSYRVKEAYYEYYYIGRTTAILRENLQLLEHLESVIREKYRTGTAPFTGLVKIQVELDKLKDQLTGVNDMLVPLKARLNTVMNRPPSDPLPLPEALPETSTTPEPSQLSFEELAAKLKQNNPGLKSLDAMISKEQTGIRLAKKNSLPDFSLGVDYIITGDARMPGVMDSSKDPVMVMLSLQLPIWSKKNRASVNEATARYRAAVNQEQETENSLLSQLEMILYNYRDARRKIVLYRDSLLPKAQQALEVTRSAFETGKADFLDFIDSQRTLLAFSLAYEEAKTREAQRLAELEMIIGEKL